MKITLSKKQQSVVDFDGKNLLVVAGAGSGKTRVLTERIKSLISALKSGEKVLAITFSNKATDELRDRLILSIGEQKLNECAYIGTTHKFCLDIVTSRGNIIGLPNDLHICESYNDRLKIFTEAIENVPQFKAQHLCDDPKENQKIIKDLLEELSAAKRNLKFSSDYNDLDENFGFVFEEYDNMLLQQGVIDFDDILRYAYKIFTERDSVANIYRKIYKYICVDEAQDLNKAQYEVIKALAGNNSCITMVGDPNQSIYGFNGSTSDYINHIFIKEFNATKMILDENYRSSKKVIAAANIIENSFETHGVCPFDGEFEISNFTDDKEEALFVYDKVCELVESGHSDVENHSISLNQCAVIARNRYVFNFLEEILKANKVEYTLKVSAKGSFSSESDLMKAFELGIRLIVNEKDKIHLSEFSKLIKTKTKCNTFEELRKTVDISDYWQVIMNVLNGAWDILLKNEKEIKFYISIKAIRDFIDKKDPCIDEHEEILVDGDLKIWEENWKSYVKKSSVGERTLANFVRTVSLGSAYNPDDKGVVLTTVHMSKGLEYDVVFVMGLNEGVFPDYRAVNAYNYNNDEKQLIEERHNMFVAITRSKRLCYLTYPLIKNTPWGQKHQRQSRYIDELVDGNIAISENNQTNKEDNKND